MSFSKAKEKPPVTFWGRITGTTPKAWFVQVALEDGTLHETTLAKSITTNASNIRPDLGSWQQFQAPGWWWDKLGTKQAPAASAPAATASASNLATGAPAPVPAPARSPAPAPAPAPPTGQPLARVPARVQEIHLPSKAGDYMIEGGRLVPNAWKVQQAANQERVSTQVVRVDTGDRGVSVTVRAFRADDPAHFVEATVDFNFEVKRQMFILDAIDAYAKAEKLARRTHQRVALDNPLRLDERGQLLLAEDGTPLLTPQATYNVWKRWIKAKNFAIRECETKAMARAQWKLLNKEWREPEEQEAEAQEVRAVAAGRTVIPPAPATPPASEAELDAEVAATAPDAEGNEDLEAKEEQERKGQEGKEQEGTTPGKTLILDDWEAFLGALEVVSFPNDPTGLAIARKIVKDHRDELNYLRQVFPFTELTPVDLEQAFKAAASRQDENYFNKVAGLVRARLATGLAPTRQLWASIQEDLARSGYK